MYHGVSFALEFCLAVVRPLDGSLASNLPTRCPNCAVRTVCSLITAFRHPEKISHPFTCYEHGIATSDGCNTDGYGGLQTMHFWSCQAMYPQFNHFYCHNYPVAAHTGRVRSNMNCKQHGGSLWLLTAARLGLTWGKQGLLATIERIEGFCHQKPANKHSSWGYMPWHGKKKYLTCRFQRGCVRLELSCTACTGFQQSPLTWDQFADGFTSRIKLLLLLFTQLVV